MISYYILIELFQSIGTVQVGGPWEDPRHTGETVSLG